MTPNEKKLRNMTPAQAAHLEAKLRASTQHLVDLAATISEDLGCAYGFSAEGALEVLLTAASAVAAKIPRGFDMARDLQERTIVAYGGLPRHRG